MRNTDFLLLFLLMIVVTITFMDYAKQGKIFGHAECYDHDKSIDVCVMENDFKT